VEPEHGLRLDIALLGGQIEPVDRLWQILRHAEPHCGQPPQVELRRRVPGARQLLEARCGLVVLLELHGRLRPVQLPFDVGLRLDQPRKQDDGQAQPQRECGAHR
jgi:hypothetical protein